MVRRWLSISIIVFVGILMILVLYKGGVSLTSYISEDAEKDFVDSTSSYNCEENVYDCSDFKFQENAQRVFDLCGGVENDVHYLDGDNDEKACEALDSEPEDSFGIPGFGFY